MRTVGRNLWLIVANGLLVLSLLVCVLLSQRASALHETVEDMRQRLTIPHEGMPIPAMHLLSDRGTFVDLGRPAEGGVEVLFFYSPHCPYCASSMPAMRKLQREVPASARIIAISVDDQLASATFLSQDEFFAESVFLGDDRSLLEVLKVSAVPVIMVVGSGGRVVYVHRGRLAVADDVTTLIQATTAATAQSTNPEVKS